MQKDAAKELIDLVFDESRIRAQLDPKAFVKHLIATYPDKSKEELTSIAMETLGKRLTEYALETRNNKRARSIMMKAYKVSSTKALFVVSPQKQREAQDEVNKLSRMERKAWRQAGSPLYDPDVVRAFKKVKP